MATLPSGYWWSPKIPAPAQLKPMFRYFWGVMSPGYYDCATVPIGDNWSLATGGAFTTVRIDSSCDVSYNARFPQNEPSAGYFMIQRGPYASPEVAEAQRGAWRINCSPAGLVFRRLSAPVYGHTGSRFDRYNTNGYAWLGEGFYPTIDSGYWNKGTPVGPKKFYKQERILVTPSQLGPDITILSNVQNRPVYISITIVDMLGRETNPSPALMVDYTQPSAGGSYIGVYRDYDVPMGSCGFYLYAGYSPDTMTRQPVLNYVGSTPKYMWPIWLQQFILHDIVNTGIKPKPPTVDGVASVLCSPQKQYVDGKMVITYNESEYNLYCPFILRYDSSKFGRILGNHNKTCIFKHQSKWLDGRPIMTDIPLLYIQNQRDKIYDASFQSDTALVGVTFSDWSGGQGFSDTIERCGFYLAGEDTYGFLVDNRCSMWEGNHTASETRIKECQFVATIPVKVEGNQTAKIRFTNMCGFYATGNTRYKANTVGIVYACSPNDFDFMDVEGVNGAFRSIVGCHPMAGDTRVTISEFFIDQGCPVYASISSYQPSTVQFIGGERINAHSQDWARLVEAPTALGAVVKFDGVRITGQASAISFQLNQLSLNLDSPLAELIIPNDSVWLQRGLQFEYPAPNAKDNGAYYNFKDKRTLRFTANYADVNDSIKLVPSLEPQAVSNGVFNKVKSFFLRSK